MNLFILLPVFLLLSLYVNPQKMRVILYELKDAWILSKRMSYISKWLKIPEAGTGLYFIHIVAGEFH